jgi:hypothetical protein
MILDGLLTFTGTSNGQSGGITSGPQTDKPTTGTQVSSNILDIGVISGVPTSANGGGARDLGIGDDPALKLSAIVTTAFTGGTSMQLTLLGAPDNGSGAPGSFTTMWTSPVFTEAQLVAGIQLCNVDLPRVIDGQVLVRFFELNYISVGTHTTAGVEAQIVLDLDQQVMGPTTLYSGYPAGVTVAN